MIKPADTLHARTKAYAKGHTLKSWRVVLSPFFPRCRLNRKFAASAADSAISLSVRIFFSLLTGLLVLRLFVIYHDQQHRAILPKSKPEEL